MGLPPTPSDVPTVVVWALCLIIATLVATLGFLSRAWIKAIISGDLVPRQTLNDALEREKAWRDAHGISEAAREKQHEITAQILPILQGVAAVLHAIPIPPQYTAPEGRSPS